MSIEKMKSGDEFSLPNRGVCKELWLRGNFGDSFSEFYDGKQVDEITSRLFELSLGWYIYGFECEEALHRLNIYLLESHWAEHQTNIDADMIERIVECLN